ncbi:MAG: hypothetical protein HY700_06755 [Gemmatimonadetes bacterium]|nr:hypothetical protein [Gemmatimonadota bacterium]
MRVPDDQTWNPRFPFAWAALVYALATMTLAYPALSGGFLVTPPSDQYIGGYPVREFAAQLLREQHRFPQWSPYIFGGMPYIAAMHGDIFYPTFLLRVLLPTDVAMTWSFIVHVFLAGLMTFGFLRACRLGFFPALIGGLAYMMSGNIAGLVSPGHDGKLYISALFPLTLWLLVLGVRYGRAWTWGALGIVIGLAVLSPHPQLLQYMLLASAAFAIYLGFGPWPGEPLARAAAIRRLAYGLGAVVVGFAIGAIQYLPVMEYVSWSPRAGGLPSYELATSYSMPPEEFINAYLPQFSGILSAYWGRNGIHHHSDYIGATVLLLAGAAFAGRGPRTGKQFVWFWTGTLAVATLWAMGGFTPFYRLIYAIVPGTKFFRAPSTILYLVTFCVAVLAAIGFERLVERELRVRYLVGWAVAAALVAVLAAAGFFTGIGSAFVQEFRQSALVANAGAVKLGALRSLLFVGVLTGVWYAWYQQKLRPAMVGVLVAAVVILDLWSVVRLYWGFSPRAAILYASDPTIEYMKQQTEPGRVLPLVTGSSQVAYHDPFLQGDALMVHKVRDAVGYHGNHIARYGRLGADDERLMLHPRFWQLANVKYLLTNAPNLESQGLHLAVGPVRNAAGTTVYLYDLPGDNPLAWMTPAIIQADDDQVFGALYHPNFDPRTVALFDTAAVVKGRTDLKQVPAPLAIKVSVRRFEAGHIILDLDGPAPAGSAMVVSENYYPGWGATVSGKAVPVGRADLSLIGVELPEGARDVELTFRSASYERGRAVTVAGLMLSLLVAVAGVVMDRRGTVRG